MAIVQDVIFCLNATNSEGKGVSAHSILTALNPEYVPGLFSFSTVITVLDIDRTKGHQFRVVFGNETEILGKIEGEFPVIDDSSNLPDKQKGINLSINWSNINLKTEGEYQLTVFLDGIQLKEKKIYVKGKNQ